MNITQIENLYKANGIKDNILRNTEDLLKVHGVDFKAVDGYNRLDDLNRQLYEKFIVNIYNMWGLESRSTIIPRGIYYVEEIEYLVKEEPEDDYYTVAGGIIKAIDRSGLNTVLHNWLHEDYKNFDVIEGEAKTYLRFEYEHDGRNEWLHVTNENSWY